jgi:hypothetical protein
VELEAHAELIVPRTKESRPIPRRFHVQADGGGGGSFKVPNWHLKDRPREASGVAMLSSVLSSKRAVLVNVEIVRALVRLREILSSNADLARKLAALEGKYDRQFRVVFDAIRQLMSPPTSVGRPIGFTADIE